MIISLHLLFSNSYLQSSFNVLIKSGIAKITDFGLSGQNMSSSIGEGTEAYRDPLSFRVQSYKRGKKSDIFSLGVLLWEISSGQIPCEKCMNVAEYRKNGYRDLPFPGTPETYVQLYSTCCSESPDERPSCEEIYKQLKLLFNNQNLQPKGKTLDLSWKSGGIGVTTAIAALK